MTLSTLFSDGCVLRQGLGTKIWGCGAPGERVTVRFQGETYDTIADGGGKWRIFFGVLSPGGPFELHVSGAESQAPREITLRDVYVGEVWLCAGQSNMQITFTRIGRRYPEVMSAPDEPELRRFLPPDVYDVSAPRGELSGGEWLPAGREHIADFSAIGYFFGKMRRAKAGVPVGLIQTAIGGTPIHAWLKTPPKTTENSASTAPPSGYPGKFNAMPCNPEVTQSRSGTILWRKRVTIPAEFAGQRAELALGTIVDSDETFVNGELVGSTAYRYPPRYYITPALSSGECEVVVRQSIFGGWGKFTEGKTRELRFDGGVIPLDGDWERRRETYFPETQPLTVEANEPCGYYNGIIAPLTEFAITGALWYQGESDDRTPEGYFERFSQLVSDWRGAWGYDFPILTVGLARFDETDWTAIREQQALGATLPRVKYFDAWDYGEPNDLHPLEKRPIGEGLARLLDDSDFGV
jgi:sialate O-acetylesterase